MQRAPVVLGFIQAKCVLRGDIACASLSLGDPAGGRVRDKMQRPH